ncbi:MAG TPA: multiheme c-type cytochrome, partial [Urbifossiella sp.]
MRIASCLILGFILTGLAFAERTEPGRIVPPPYGLEPQPHFAHTSAASCSASACHGGGHSGKPGSEHITWAQQIIPIGNHDPHSRAYRTLFNKDSVRIARLLGGRPAHENILCLKCHAPAGVEDRTARAEGVGCSACHGPSDKWLAEHYLPSWKAKSNRDKWTETGFIPTKNLVARISNCASCHVGSADREVNHDLIAAGHPRLAFEYTRFHFQSHYRKHWDERTPQPDFEVRAWTIGQAVSLRAAIDVLKSRAEQADKNAAPWPEFAGMSCYACHQSIGGEANGGIARGHSLGQPAWELWYTAAVDRAGSASAQL